MRILINKPYKVIWFTVPFILSLTMMGSTNMLYMQLFDTTLIVALTQVGILSSFVLLLSGCIYWLVRNKKLINWMTIVHSLIVIFSFIFLHSSSFIITNIEDVSAVIFRILSQVQFGLILIILASQLIFISNVFISLIKNEKK